MSRIEGCYSYARRLHATEGVDAAALTLTCSAPPVTNSALTGCTARQLSAAEDPDALLAKVRMILLVSSRLRSAMLPLGPQVSSANSPSCLRNRTLVAP